MKLERLAKDIEKGEKLHVPVGHSHYFQFDLYYYIYMCIISTSLHQVFWIEGGSTDTRSKRTKGGVQSTKKKN